MQHRPYVLGDDLRHLDWKVFGKTDRFFVRQYEEETSLRATILVDASGSMAYASQAVSKLDYAVRLAAALAYLLSVKQNDAVGLLTCPTAGSWTGKRASGAIRCSSRWFAASRHVWESTESASQ